MPTACAGTAHRTRAGIVGRRGQRVPAGGGGGTGAVGGGTGAVTGGAGTTTGGAGAIVGGAGAGVLDRGAGVGGGGVSAPPGPGGKLGRRRGRCGQLRRHRRRRRPRRAAQSIVQLGCRAAHFVREARRVERGPDNPRRDQDDQLGLVDALRLGAEQVAQDRNVLEQRDSRVAGRSLLLDHAPEHERLVVHQHDGGLGFSLDDRRRGRHPDGRLGDVVDFLLHVERHRSALADARRDGQDDARVPILNGLGPDDRRRGPGGRPDRPADGCLLGRQDRDRGVETMLTRFSEASVFNIAKNLSVAKDHAVNPAGSGPNTLLLPRNWFAGA